MSVVVKPDDDEGFSGKHLEVVSTIRYLEAKLEVQHVVWAFPDAPGLRTQLRVKALPGFDGKAIAAGAATGPTQVMAGRCWPRARIDYLPLDFARPNSRRYWGYYNDPGNRHDQSKDMLEEKIVRGYPIFQPEAINWASGQCVEYGEEGVVTVKESPKCVNQPAHLTGGFFSGPQGLAVTGWGLSPAEIVPERFRDCWATWTIVYRGGNDGMQMALKQFDRARYPVIPRRDMFILANTWGPANPGGAQFTGRRLRAQGDSGPGRPGRGRDANRRRLAEGRRRSRRTRFSAEISAGLETTSRPPRTATECALGLWVAIRNANLAELQKNLDELGFITWKCDFDHLASRSDYEARHAKYRAVMTVFAQDAVYALPGVR